MKGEKIKIPTYVYMAIGFVRGLQSDVVNVLSESESGARLLFAERYPNSAMMTVKRYRLEDCTMRTGDQVTVRDSAGKTHAARVMSAYFESPNGWDYVILDINGHGVQRFHRTGDAWQPAGLRHWDGEVTIEPER